MKLTASAFLTCAGTALSATTVVPVSEDGWYDYGNNTVFNSGVGQKLNVATPNPSGASAYTRKAAFGFNVSAVDLSSVTSVTFTVTAAGNIDTSYNGQSSMRFYLVSNSIADSFDETAMTATNIAWDSQGNVLTSDRVIGTSLGDFAVSNPASGQAYSVTFNTAALADLANDTNDFLTIVAEFRGQNNAGYSNELTDTTVSLGQGFVSKEGGTGAGSLSFETIPEPSSSLLLGLAGLGLLIRRRR